jgi:hypothetical protein
MTIARCTEAPCGWEVDFPDGPDAAQRGLDRHREFRHDIAPPAVEAPHVPVPVKQLAHVDWRTQALDALAQLARGSLRTGEPFTVFEVAKYGVGEPINPQYDWGKLTRDAAHLGLIQHATDADGHELSTRSARPATKGSLVSLWGPGHAITGHRSTPRSDTA